MATQAAIFEWTQPIIIPCRRQEKQTFRDKATLRPDSPNERIR